MQTDPVLKIELAIKDNILKKYAFTQDIVEIGRVPTADIFIDNSGISRSHTKIERSVGGPYIVRDMGSTNGTFLNNRQVDEAELKNNDVIMIGKFSLRVIIESAGNSKSSRPMAPDDFDGTTVLSAEQMAQLRSSIGNNKHKVLGQTIPVQESSGSGMPLSRMLLWGGIILAVIVIAVLLFK
ncbi:MAG: FHA domain-containing protein [Desulfosalsimonadaceae bacterium]